MSAESNGRGQGAVKVRGPVRRLRGPAVQQWRVRECATAFHGLVRWAVLMPFKAMLDGREVVSFLMTDEEWSGCLAASKEDQSRLVMPVTGVPCFGRPSSRGLRHFVHRSGAKPEGETDSESWQHRMLKKLVAEQALSMGWEVDIEVPAPGGQWVADTMMGLPHG